MKTHIGRILIIASLLAFLDQLSKYFVIKYLAVPYHIIDNFLFLEYSENRGIAFGLPMPYYFSIFGGVLLMGVILYMATKELNLKLFLGRFAVALIIGGAIGNIIDRIVNGFVVDFIGIWKWPNFNLADSFITVGVLLIIVFYGKIKTDERN